MSDRSSRHAELSTYRRRIPGRETEVELFEPRFRQAPPAVRHHTVQAAERLDLLAYRYMDDPHQYWRIADANADVGLEALLEPGRLLAIPERP
jgi:hypothetical protein